MKEKCKIVGRDGKDSNEVRILQGRQQKLIAVNPNRYVTLCYISSPISRTSDFLIDEKYVVSLGTEPYSYTIEI